MDGDVLLKIQNLELSFFTPAGEIKALNDVSFSMKTGDVLGIVGESGSGKSVMAYAVMGLLPHSGKIINGTIDFNGHRVNNMTEKEMRSMRGSEIGMVFQDPMTSLNPVYTIGNQICEVLELHSEVGKKLAKFKAEELMALVGIDDPQRRMKQYPYELSGGMLQRIMITIVLACKPKLLIADEPTTALDVTIQAQILELILELKDKMGMSTIMITHNLGIVANICNVIAIMYYGKIVECGTTEDIFYRSKHEYTKGLLKSIPNLSAAKSEKLIPIEGEPIDALNPPLGCPFAPRCKACMEICLRKMPPYTQIDGFHYSACWLIQKKAFERVPASGQIG